MHADISRRLFDPAAHYTAVRAQQGRVLLDADFNEQVDLDTHDRRTTRRDVIGPTGAPTEAPGMAVTATSGGAGLALGPGRFYVDGIRCENPDEVVLDVVPEQDGTYLVHLEVWERPVSAAQDPRLREVALGGADTTTRTRVEWAVRFLPVPDATECTDDPAAWQRLTAGPTGTAAVDSAPEGTTVDPCLVPETAGFRGLDNRAYVVAVHDGNFDPAAGSGSDGTSPTFVWSRDGGSVVGRLTAPPSGVEVTVDRLGPGGAEGFLRGGWVEVTNDARLRAHQPGVLAEVDDVVDATLVLVDGGGLATELATVWDPDLHPIARRWDSPGAQPLTTGTPLDLEDGIRVTFGAGTWRSGSWWLVAARTAVMPGTDGRHLDWPSNAGGGPLPMTAHGHRLHHARLAMAIRDGGTWEATDCRAQFAPLTRQLTLTGRGGDGQEAPGGHWLPAPLTIGVSRGAEPMPGARLRVSVAAGGGSVGTAAPGPTGSSPPTTGSSVEVDTDPDGLARTWWRLGPTASPEGPGDRFHAEADQRVVVELLDPGGDPDHLALQFHARAVDPLVLVAAGGNGQLGTPGDTLEIALRARVSSGQTPAPGRRVRFTVPSTMLDGTALDEFRGGSLHATTNVVETTPWPGGQRIRVADVATDAAGVAQLQWVLGTEEGLPVQRVTAVLLDDDGAPTDQETLFAAHLAIARQIAWSPPAGAGSALGATETVQDALAALGLLGLIGLTQAAILDGGGATTTVQPGTSVPFGAFAGVRVTSGWQPSDDPSAAALLGGLVVAADRPLVEGGATRGFEPVHLVGKTEFTRSRRGLQLDWLLTDSKPLLEQALSAGGGTVVVRIRLLPAAMARRTPVPPPWETAVRITA